MEAEGHPSPFENPYPPADSNNAQNDRSSSRGGGASNAKRRGRGYHSSQSQNQGYRGGGGRGGRGGYRQESSTGDWRNDGGRDRDNRQGRGGGAAGGRQGGENSFREEERNGYVQPPQDRHQGPSRYQQQEENRSPYRQHRGSYRGHDRDRDRQRQTQPRGGYRDGGGGEGQGQRRWKPPNSGRPTNGEQFPESTLNPMAAPFTPGGSSSGSSSDTVLGSRNEVSEELPWSEDNAYHEPTPNNARSPHKSQRGTYYGRNQRDYTRGGGGGGGRGKAPSQNNFGGNSNSRPKEERNDSEERDRGGKGRNQREVLVDQLTRNVYECMVCVEKVRATQPIWACKRCFNLFHLNCIRKWATSSVDENGWRCPGCQSYCEVPPTDYYCFCGKVKNPKNSRYDFPHTCGQTCGKSFPGGLKCTHSCTTPCHPGPCPPCDVQQTRFCGCGKTSASVLCSSKTILSCAQKCDKALECKAHRCSRTCHYGECDPCEEKLTHVCHCSSERREVTCTSKNNESKHYSCGQSCKKPLRCGSHLCDSTCHPGTCGPCKTSTEAVMSCPCGQTSISEACKIARIPIRKKCTDPIPTCGKICQRILPCGDEDSKHRCLKKCHLDNMCPPCDKTSSVKCRCGNKTIDIACKELRVGEEITCQKKCNKKRSCGKHKCNLKCCIDMDHICTLACQRQLRCGIHNCSSLCHLNPCPPCGIVSFDELSCECGASIIYPPVPCGTRRPPCQLPCSREHDCDHPVHHACHSEAACPPCTVLTSKWCHGGHELRSNIMCHITEISCGLPCGEMLPCRRHCCPERCHAGECLKDGEVCKLPCNKLRSCGHKCGAPCHEDDCPESKCKIMTNVACPCGRKKDTLICWKRDIEYDRTVTWEYHKELKKLEEAGKQKGENVEMDDAFKQELMGKMKEKIPKFAVLECDKECAKVERNRKLAEALQVDNADVTASVGTPNYSEFLTKFAKKDPKFVEMIHDQLTALVMKAKQSRKKNETYGFISMNRDKRHVVHEYSDYFGVISESFDEEPNRNVVCFASKEKSYLPSVSLVTAVFRPPAIRSERRKPHDDVTFHPEKRTQIVGPANWKMKPAVSSSQVVTLNIPGNSGSSHASDFPPL